MKPFPIFIGDDSRMQGVADVLAHSLRKHSSITLDIRKLVLPELARTTGFNRSIDPLASTEFTYTRFLVPHLMDYTGIALFMDNDMLAMGDVAAIARLDMTDIALRVVQHPPYVPPTGEVKMDGRVQTSYPRKNWSSVMLMNCAKLKAWTRQAVETKSGAWLHRFEPIPDHEIGELPPAWNVLDALPPGGRIGGQKVQLLHYTSGGPWFPNMPQETPEARLWFAARDEAQGAG